MVKKKECVALCALEACRILNSEGVLKQSRSESQRKKKERDWESADYYDSDEDNFLDRTGDVERKRLQRMAQAGKLDEKTAKSMPGLLKNKVHTFESILNDMKVLLGEKYDIEVKVEKCKAVFKAVAEDDLDSYIESLKVGAIDTVTRAKLKRRLAELKMELNKLDKLLAVAKPKDFSIEEWKLKINQNLLTNQVEQMETEPIKVTEEVPASKIELPEKIKEPVIVNEEVEIKEKVTNVFGQNEIKKRVHKEKEPIREVRPIVENESTKGIAKKQKVTQEYEEYSNSADYAVWLPPENQTGDGKTSLNAKYGY